MLYERQMIARLWITVDALYQKERLYCFFSDQIGRIQLVGQLNVLMEGYTEYLIVRRILLIFDGHHFIGLVERLVTILLM